MRVLSGNGGVMKAKDIAQQAGLGNAKKDANRYLYCLQVHGYVELTGNAEWRVRRTATGRWVYSLFDD